MILLPAGHSSDRIHHTPSGGRHPSAVGRVQWRGEPAGGMDAMDRMDRMDGGNQGLRLRTAPVSALHILSVSLGVGPCGAPYHRPGTALPHSGHLPSDTRRAHTRNPERSTSAAPHSAQKVFSRAPVCRGRLPV